MSKDTKDKSDDSDLESTECRSSDAEPKNRIF